VGIVETTPPPNFVHVSWRAITIDTDRATVTLNTRLVNSIVITRGSFQEDINSTERELHRGTTRISPCADILATELAKVARVNSNPAKELFLHAADRQKLVDALENAIEGVLRASPCPSETDKDRNDAVMDVERAFLELAAGGAKPISGSTDVSFSPLERVTLGVAGGAMFRQRGALRAKLDDSGKIIADPPSGLLSMAALHWHPIAFDGASEPLSFRERASIIAGIVVTPEPGLAGGLSWTFFRGLSFNVSHAWLLVNTQTADHPFGSVPESGVNPFRKAWTRTVVVGFGYKFD
jgi:hypothetical protein